MYRKTATVPNGEVAVSAIIEVSKLGMGIAFMMTSDIHRCMARRGWK